MNSTPAQMPAPMMVNDTGLVGKVVIVTGGGAFDDGISNGRAASILCAHAGAHVVVVGRGRGPAERTVQMITEEGRSAVVITGDVSKEADCRAIVEQTVDRFGLLRVLLPRKAEGPRVRRLSHIDGRLPVSRPQPAAAIRGV